jgi:hypothetical protein
VDIMFTILRRLFSLGWGAIALTSVVFTSPAYAQALPRDPPPPADPVPGPAAASVAMEVRWMLIGAGLVLLAAAAGSLIAAAYRRIRSAFRLRVP